MLEMRLLDTEKLRLCEFADDAIPPYAILSHTWAREEVTLQDLLIGSSTSKEGYAKLVGASSIAKAAGFEYIWIDTCCIDKTDKAELSEAIDSMYQWYQEALVCFAYLEDVCSTEDSSSLASQVSKSRWFTRGWTLQELIAPRKVHFIARDWVMLGTRISLLSIISDVTRIPVRFLLGDDIKNASIGQRLSWAAGRKTTKTEDMAYCLLGILRIHMPLLYGEREHAFIRLQEELMEAYDDQSILAWQSSSCIDRHICDALATNPSAFKKSGHIVRSHICLSRRHLMATRSPLRLDNKGIHVSLPIMQTDEESEYLAVLNCVDLNKNWVAMRLFDISVHGGRFTRMEAELEFLDSATVARLPVREVTIERIDRNMVNNYYAYRSYREPLSRAFIWIVALLALLVAGILGVCGFWVCTMVVRVLKYVVMI